MLWSQQKFGASAGPPGMVSCVKVKPPSLEKSARSLLRKNTFSDWFETAGSTTCVRPTTLGFSKLLPSTNDSGAVIANA